MHLPGRGDELGRVGGAHGEHLAALGLYADRLEQALHELDAVDGVEVADTVVALLLEAAGDVHAVGAFGQSGQQVQRADPAGAGQQDAADRRRQRDARVAGRVGGGVGALAAVEGDDAAVAASRPCAARAARRRGASSSTDGGRLRRRRSSSRHLGEHLVVGEAAQRHRARRDTRRRRYRSRGRR